MWIRLPKHELAKLPPVPEKQKQNHGETNWQICRDRTKFNYNTANIHNKRRLNIAK